MIMPEKAFELAQSFCRLYKLAPLAYDLNKYWLFEYGEDKEVYDAWPIIVNKETGETAELLDDDEYDEIWDKIDEFPAIELNLENSASPAKKA